MPEEDWPVSQAQRAVIIGDFDDSSAFGDRRQARLLAADLCFAQCKPGCVQQSSPCSGERALQLSRSIAGPC